MVEFKGGDEYVIISFLCCFKGGFIIGRFKKYFSKKNNGDFWFLKMLVGVPFFFIFLIVLLLCVFFDIITVFRFKMIEKLFSWLNK